ncbi:MAG: TonB-dependent receptor [Cryomorphaceae bacterium]|nr:TonB-dependent receptor [Cryomorphaceae bacterium]
MKSLILFVLCLIIYTGTSAQKVLVINQNTWQAIEGVSVLKLSDNSLLAVSDVNGEIVLTSVSLDEQLVFKHPLYSEIYMTLEQLQKMGGKLFLKENVNSIDEIVVSASKFEEKRKDVAQKIQVIRSSEIQEINQSSTADVLASTGNVMVQKSQLGGGSPIIRGFEANRVLMVIDGVRMNNAIYRGGHLQNIITLDNAIMDRVEVVYGPGSVVYGSDALGGVMSFTTKDPVLSKDDKLKVKVGQYMRYMSAVSGYSSNANVSLAKKRFGSLTSITYSDYGDLRQGANREPFVGNFGSRPWYVVREDGKDKIVKNVDTNLQVGSGYLQTDFLQKFLFKQNEYVKHTLNVQYSTSSDVPRYDRLTQVSGGLPKFAEWNYGPQERLLASYTLQLSNKKVLYDNARLILAYQKIEESRKDRKYNNPGRNNRFENLDIFSVNFDLAKKLGKNELRYGLEGWYNKVESTAFTENIETGDQTPLDTRYASGGAQMNSLAAYVTHTLEISDRLILNDGLRFSAIGLNAKFTDTTFFKFPFKEAKQQNSAFTGNIGLVYMPVSDFRITCMLSSGFRAPNVDDLSKVFESVPGTINVPNTNLKPEYTYNGEIGISNRFGDWLNVQATGYYTLYRNALTTQNFTYNGQDSIVYEGVMSRVVATTNANKAFLYGLELALNGELNKFVTIYATYNYTYARIVTDSVAIPLDHIPPTFGKLGIQLTEGKFRSDFFVNYSGWKRISDYNPFGEDNQAFALPQGMPSWYTINARATYQFNKLISIQLACENILDRNYRVFASNISAPGRNFIATLRWNF